jgi:hypothetical protein
MRAQRLNVRPGQTPVHTGDGRRVNTEYDSPLRSLRPHLRNGASWRAGAGRVRTVAILSILHGCVVASHLLRYAMASGALVSFLAIC